jgi:hypothetical protein
MATKKKKRKEKQGSIGKNVGKLEPMYAFSKNANGLHL